MSAEHDAELRQLQRDRDIEAVMGTPEGRRLAWRIIAEWGELFGLAVDPDARIAAVLEGRRAVGLSLYHEVQRVTPELHARMVAEALAEQQADRELAEAEASRK